MKRKRKNSMIHSSPHLGGLVYDWRYHLDDAPIARTNIGYSDNTLEVFVSLDTGDTIVSYSGTSTPSLDIGNDKIIFTTGTIWDLLLSNGTFIPFSEGNGLLFDTTNKNPLLITDASSNLWSQVGTHVGNNLLNSCNIGRVCDATGILYRTQTQAYGEWIIDQILDRPSSGSLDFYFISTAEDVYPNTNGYSLSVNSVGTIYVQYVLGASYGTVCSKASYIDTTHKLYRTKITRDSNGLFTIYGQKQGSSYPIGGDDWETLCSGTHNTTTTSAHMLYDAQTDKCELLTVATDDGILNLSIDTTSNTGTWSTKYIPVEYGKENIDVLGRITIQRNGNWWNNCESALDLSAIEPIGLKCTSDGLAYTTSTQNYGTWTFDVNYQSSKISAVNFITNSATIPRYDFLGYVFIIGLDTLYLRRVDGDGVISNNVLGPFESSVVNNTFYRIKITRDLNNLFSLYVKGRAGYPVGGSEWELMGTGTDSTYQTNCTNLCIDSDTGSSIRSIYIGDTFISGDDFTVASGAYSDIDIMDRSNTDIWKSVARSAITYDSGNPHEWKPEDLALIDDWVEDDYTNIAYVKYTESHLVGVLIYDHQLTDEEDQTTRDWVADGLPYINANYVTHNGIVADYDGYNIIFYD